MTTKHWMEMIALIIIGEGVFGVVHPEKHIRLWRIGPKRLNVLVDNFAAHPTAMRFVFAAQIVLGYYMAKRQVGE